MQILTILVGLKTFPKSLVEDKNKLNNVLGNLTLHITVQEPCLISCLITQCTSFFFKFKIFQLTVGLIKMMMEIPLLRLRSIFKRYIRMRHFQAAKGIYLYFTLSPHSCGVATRLFLFLFCICLVKKSQD